MRKKLLLEMLDSDSIKNILNNLSENQDFEVLGWISRKIQSLITPFIDIYEENDFLMIVVDVPGYQKSDLDIEVFEGDNEIKISGVREKKMKDYIEDGRAREFEKKIKLPYDIEGRGKASLSEGVLEIKLEKEEKESTKVEIN